MSYPNWLINVVVNNEQCSKRDAKEMIDIWMLTEGGMLELGEVCRKWGVEEKKIHQAGLNVVGSSPRGNL
jgi:hypothetical protein